MNGNSPNEPTEQDLVRVVVEVDSCIGGGQCEMLEPNTFLVGEEDGLASVVGDGVLPRDRALNAIDRCPGRAIALVELDES